MNHQSPLTPPSTPSMEVSPLHRNALHESGILHAKGEARYVDDLPLPPHTLWAWPVLSTKAYAKLESIDLGQALELEGVAAVLTAGDVPGINDASAFAHDEPLLAHDYVRYVGHPVACVYADSLKACRAAAALVKVEYSAAADRPILSIRESIERDAYHGTPHLMKRGDVKRAIAESDLELSGEFDSGAQDHFYLETHAALCVPLERGRYQIYSSTQHPSEVQAKVAEVLDLRRSSICVEAPRMGGGFGGKETQGAHIAMLSALGSYVTGRPVKLWLNRDQDMMMTGKRHPFYSRYRAGFSAEGDLLGLQVEVYANGGWAEDLSSAILDRCLFHLDNPYYIPTLRFEGKIAKTNLPSNTAFRGFGGPQGALIIEEVMNRAAERLKIEPAALKRRNFYGEAPRNLTPYWQPVLADRSARIFDELTASAHYQKRRSEIDQWNQQHPWVKRGIAYQAVKFGISFTASPSQPSGCFGDDLCGWGAYSSTMGGLRWGKGCIPRCSPSALMNSG